MEKYNITKMGIQDASKQKDSGCDRYGKQRIDVANEAITILNSANIPWYLEGGTLLGAYRNGKLISHDDDFDIAVVMNEEEFAKMCDHMAKNLPKHLECRIVKSYTTKLEVYDPSMNIRIFSGSCFSCNFNLILKKKLIIYYNVLFIRSKSKKWRKC